MKKKIFLILPIIVLMIMIIIITVIDKKDYSIDFNIDLELSINDTKITNSIKSFSNEQYNIEKINTKELTLEEEQQIIETALNITNAYNDITNDKYVSNIEKYVVRIPEHRLDEILIYTDDFKKWSDKVITIEALANLFQSRNATFESIKGTQITYTSSERSIVQVYVDNYKITYGSTAYGLDAIFEYEIVYEEASGLYKVNNLAIEWVKDLNDYYQQTETKERNQNKYNSSSLSNVSSYIPSSYTNFDYSKLKQVSSHTTTNIYNQNKDSIVIIDSASQGGMPTGSASGFYIRSGVVVTSYDSIYRMIENGAVRYYAVDSNDKITEIEGIISVYPEINIAILKLKEENGTKVTIGDSSTLEKNDPIVVISSSLGLKSSIKLGIYFDTLEDDYKVIRTSLPLIDGDAGSAVFNLNGEVIAINTSVSTSKSEYNSGLNNATDISILKDVINKLNNQKFQEIKSFSFDNIIKNEDFKVINEVDEKNWKKYEELPLITKVVPLSLYSAYTNDNYLIVRYKQENYNVLTNEEIIKLYTKMLATNSFNPISANVYKKDNITIRIQNNLGYIIIIVEGVI
ncbi:MAG: serine protease [Firmicutes bacterium]|nr:serine protease [Bacillota bacterium]